MSISFIVTSPAAGNSKYSYIVARVHYNFIYLPQVFIQCINTGYVGIRNYRSDILRSNKAPTAGSRNNGVRSHTAIATALRRLKRRLHWLVYLQLQPVQNCAACRSPRLTWCTRRFSILNNRSMPTHRPPLRWRFKQVARIINATLLIIFLACVIVCVLKIVTSSTHDYYFPGIY